MPLSPEIEDRPVFLGGIPRSGGAVLCRLLDRHPDLLVHPCQTGFFSTFVPAAAKLTNDQRIPLAERTLLRCAPEDRDDAPAGAVELDHAAVRKRFSERLLGSTMLLSDYLSSAILSIADVSGTLNERQRLWVEPTSFSELHAGRIFEWWRHARLIQIVRDPRAVFAAAQRPFGEASSIAAFAQEWLTSARRARRNLSTFGEGRCLTVHYEQLVRAPATQFSQILAFLGLEAGRVDPQPLGGAGRQFAPGRTAGDEQFAQIGASAVDAWKSELQPAQIALLEAHLADEMRAHVYEPITSPSPLRRMRLLADRFMIPTRRHGRGMKSAKPSDGDSGKATR
jgi:hypothetical protein